MDGPIAENCWPVGSTENRADVMPAGFVSLRQSSCLHRGSVLTKNIALRDLVVHAEETDLPGSPPMIVAVRLKPTRARNITRNEIDDVGGGMAFSSRVFSQRVVGRDRHERHAPSTGSVMSEHCDRDVTRLTRRHWSREPSLGR